MSRLPFTAATLVLLWVGGCNACGAAKDGGGADGTDGEASEAASDNASTDATSESSATGSSDDPSSTTDPSSSSSSSTGPSDIPPYPEACHEPKAIIDVASATTPDGPLVIDEAWLGVDYCSELPFVVLMQSASRATGPAAGFEVILRADDQPVDPLFGIYPARFWDLDATATIEVLEPLSNLEPGVANPDNHLHAQIEVHGGGWDISVEVDLLDCGVAECKCPCE